MPFWISDDGVSKFLNNLSKKGYRSIGYCSSLKRLINAFSFIKMELGLLLLFLCVLIARFCNCSPAKLAYFHSKDLRKAWWYFIYSTANSRFFLVWNVIFTLLRYVMLKNVLCLPSSYVTTSLSSAILSCWRSFLLHLDSRHIKFFGHMPWYYICWTLFALPVLASSFNHFALKHFIDQKITVYK